MSYHGKDAKLQRIQKTGGVKVDLKLLGAVPYHRDPLCPASFQLESRSTNGRRLIAASWRSVGHLADPGRYLTYGTLGTRSGGSKLWTRPKLPGSCVFLSRPAGFRHAQPAFGDRVQIMDGRYHFGGALRWSALLDSILGLSHLATYLPSFTPL
ncbi:hypothetical protein VTK56DRAFT_6195 [Thermocarpiscus australiensis]